MSELKEVPCKHVKCPALDAIALIAKEQGFGYALVGGAVRDAYHHRPANDCDIAVWECADGYPQTYDIDHVLTEAGYTLAAFHDDRPDYGTGEAADGRYDAILKYTHPTEYPVDVLVFSSYYKSLSDVLNSFDYNINQFGITVDNVEVSSRQTAYYGGDQLFVLRKLRDSRCTEERSLRMGGLADDYGWAHEVEESCKQMPLPQ